MPVKAHRYWVTGQRLRFDTGYFSAPAGPPLVALVFERNAGKALSELEIKAEVEVLIERLEAAGAHVYVPRRDRDYAITAGLRMMLQRHLVQERDGLYAADPAETALLGYYAKSIAHLLAR